MELNGTVTEIRDRSVGAPISDIEGRKAFTQDEKWKQDSHVLILTTRGWRTFGDDNECVVKDVRAPLFVDAQRK